MTRGAAALKTGLGEIEIGISAGTAARLDVHTQFGQVHNQLDAADGPRPADQAVEVRARTSYGDIMIRRAPDAGRDQAAAMRKERHSPCTPSPSP